MRPWQFPKRVAPQMTGPPEPVPCPLETNFILSIFSTKRSRNDLQGEKQVCKDRRRCFGTSKCFQQRCFGRCYAQCTSPPRNSDPLKKDTSIERIATPIFIFNHKSSNLISNMDSRMPQLLRSSKSLDLQILGFHVEEKESYRSAEESTSRSTRSSL